MTRREEEGTEELTIRQRIALYHGTKMQVGEACTLSNAAINYDSMYNMRCNPEAILAAGITPLFLAKRGVDTASRLRSLGFDAIHFRNEVFCRQAIAQIPVNELRSQFIQTAGDAVSIADTPAQRLLSMQTADLLRLCVGQPVEAEHILHDIAMRTGAETLLDGVSADDVINTCIGAQALRRCGLTMPHLVRATSLTSNQLAMMGFDISL